MPQHALSEISAMDTNPRGHTQLRAGTVLSLATSPALCTSRHVPSRRNKSMLKRMIPVRLVGLDCQIQFKVGHVLRPDFDILPA
jgi:hypothetical protein